MLSFSQLDDLLDQNNGTKPYTDGVPNPTQYTFRNYMDDATTNRHGWCGDAHKPSNYDLKPLEPDDMARYAAISPEQVQDYLAAYQTLQMKFPDHNLTPITDFNFTPAQRQTYDDEMLEKMTGLKWGPPK